MKYFLRSLLIGLLCLAPLSTDATQRVAALISPQAINVDLGFVQVGNVGNLSILGAPSGATFSLLTNPGGHFSISGTEIVAEPSTPVGQYSITVQATGTGYSVNKTFVLNYAGTPVALSIVGTNPSTAFAGHWAAVFNTNIAYYTSVANVVISDANPGAQDTVTLSLTGSAGGTLSGPGLSGSGPYTLGPDTPTNITAGLQQVFYTPPTGTESLSETITITVNSSAGVSATDSRTVVSVVGAAVAETPYSAPVGTFTPTNFKGVNISGAETGYISTSQFNYIYPTADELTYWSGKGMGLIRMPLKRLRIQPLPYSLLDPPSYVRNSTNCPFGPGNDGLLGRCDEPANGYVTYAAGTQTNLATMKAVIDQAFSLNMYVVLDLHEGDQIQDPLGGYFYRYAGTDTYSDSSGNFGTRSGSNTESTAQLIDFWIRLATKFKNYPNVIYAPMNEPAQVTAAQWKVVGAQVTTAIAGVTTSHYVFMDGACFSGGHSWSSCGNDVAWAGYTPPTPWAFDIHEYLDADFSGTNGTCAGNGSAPMTGVTSWAVSHGFLLWVGESGWGQDSSCPSDATALFGYFSSNQPNPYLGWAYWVGGNVAFYAPWNATTHYILTAAPAGYPTGPFTDAPQTSILVANLSTSSTLVLDDNFIAGTYSPGPAASNDLVDGRTSTQYVMPTPATTTAVSAGTLSISTNGLLNEPANQNLFLQSGNLTLSPWATTGTGTTTANFATAPDGTTTANRFQSTNTVAFNEQTVSGLTVGAYYTLTYWIKSNNGSEQELFVPTNSTTGDWGAQTVFAETTWQQQVVTFIASSTSMNIGVLQPFNTAIDVLVWQPQLYAGLYLNRSITPSIVPTTTSQATRSANSITIQHTGIQSLRIFYADHSQQDITGINPATQYTLSTTLKGTQIARIQGYSGALPASAPFQMVGNRGGLPWKTSGSAADQTEMVSYSHHTVGIANSEMQLVYTGRLDGGSGETPDPTCPCTIQASLYFPSAPGTKSVSFTFSGSATGALSYNQASLFTDSLLPSAFGWTSFPANADFYITTQKFMLTNQDNYAFSFNAISSSNGDGSTAIVGSTNFHDYRLAQGVGVSGSGGDLYIPLAIIGRPTVSDISAMGMGDSLEESFGNNNGQGQGGYNNFGGWFARGMSGVNAGGINGRIIPWSNTAIAGASSPTMLTSFVARSAVLPFATHLVDNYIHNSITAGENQRAFTTMLIAQQGTSMVRHFEYVTDLPFASTSDGYVTYGNQSVVNSQLYTFYGQMVAAVGTVGAKGFPNAVFSQTAITGAAATPTAFPQLWLTGATAFQYTTSDQVHPSSAGHDVMTPNFIARTSTWN